MNKTLLVIEEDITVQLILAHFLKNEYTLVAMRNSLEALAWLEAGNFADLIMANLNMPDFNGFQLIKALRASHLFKHVPILIFSGLDCSTDRIKCLELGADDCIVKPFNPAEVKARVKTILRRTTILASNHL